MLKSLTLALMLAGVTSVAQAAPLIYNDTIPAGTAAFDATVVGTGAAVKQDALRSLVSASSWTRSDYTITSTDGSSRFIDGSYISSGDSIGINPYSPADASGLTFTFATAVNAFGLEIGDWATCCYSSSLYISFDGGTTRLVATATKESDNPGVDAGLGFRNFVGAIDTSGTFSTVTFYGDGFGEYLLAGGTIRYSTLDIGSVPETPVPEPETYAMLLAGLCLVGFSARRARASHSV